MANAYERLPSTEAPAAPPLSPIAPAQQSDLEHTGPEMELPQAFPTITRQLYVSHFLSTWNIRGFEFGAVLFLATIFPGTLLPMSVYALLRAASTIVFSPMIGSYIDRGNRLQVIRVSIVGQRAAVIVSCIGFAYLLLHQDGSDLLRYAILGLLILLACLEKLCSIMNTIAVERDWVVVIASTNQTALRRINSQMRRIDLFCKLVSPLAIALIDGISTKVAILIILCTNIASVALEYILIAKVYRTVPTLASRSGTDNVMPFEEGTATSSRRPGLCGSPLQFQGLVQNMKEYICHSALLPSLSLSLLYLTVLSFSGQMVTYLLSAGYTSTNIGYIRSVCVLVEMSATWLAPIVMAKLGPVRAGIWFLSWQTMSLTVAVGLFLIEGKPVRAASYLVVGVIASRVGLWGVDLCAQIIIQEEVDQEQRGAFSTIETSLQNLMELCSFILTAVFARPDQFRYPALMSVLAVYTAAALYAGFVRNRRGHLLHKPYCLKGEEVYEYEALPLGRSPHRIEVVGATPL